MEKIKQSKIAGAFYPAEVSELEKMISGYKKSTYPSGFSSKAVIVPHAGYVYSGELAYKGLTLLNPDIKVVFIFAPSHRVSFEGISVPTYQAFSTPFGEVPIEKSIVEDLKTTFGAKENDPAFDLEHSIEVQLPLLQKIFNKISVVPVLIGAQNYELISDIIEKYYNNSDFGFVISSDLSHFLKDEEAKKLDNTTAQMIESKNLAGFRFDQACGALGIAGLVNFASKHQYSLLRVGLLNSSVALGDKTRVVGYGSWVLTHTDKNEFLKNHYSNLILDIAKSAIISKQGPISGNFPEVFNSLGASFVTLEKFERLRGCIGSIIAHRPLIEDLVSNARSAAYRDPRFKPVEQSEIADLKIAVSILSESQKMVFSDETDLLNQIVEYKDGIIIKDLGRQAVYLPSVWEQLPDKKEFLNSLKVKAGLPFEHFSKTFEAYRFYTTYIK